MYQLLFYQNILTRFYTWSIFISSLINIVVKSVDHQLQYCRVIQALIILHLILRGDLLGESLRAQMIELWYPVFDILAISVFTNLLFYHYLPSLETGHSRRRERENTKLQHIDMVSINKIQDMLRFIWCSVFICKLLLTPNLDSAFNPLVLATCLVMRRSFGQSVRRWDIVRSGGWVRQTDNNW